MPYGATAFKTAYLAVLAVVDRMMFRPLPYGEADGLPVAIGTAAGLTLAWWTARFLQAFVFEVEARNPWTFGVVAVVLAVTAVLAARRPAQRAAKTDPATMLRAL